MVCSRGGLQVNRHRASGDRRPTMGGIPGTGGGTLCQHAPAVGVGRLDSEHDRELAVADDVSRLGRRRDDPVPASSGAARLRVDLPLERMSGVQLGVDGTGVPAREGGLQLRSPTQELAVDRQHDHEPKAISPGATQAFGVHLLSGAVRGGGVALTTLGLLCGLTDKPVAHDVLDPERALVVG